MVKLTSRRVKDRHWNAPITWKYNVASVDPPIMKLEYFGCGKLSGDRFDIAFYFSPVSTLCM